MKRLPLGLGQQEPQFANEVVLATLRRLQGLEQEYVGYTRLGLLVMLPLWMC